MCIPLSNIPHEGVEETHKALMYKQEEKPKGKDEAVVVAPPVHLRLR